MSSNDTRERMFAGCLLGAAIGDALGMPIEQVGSEEVKRVIGVPIRDFCDPIPGAPCFRFALRRGMYTDDT